MAQIWYGKMQDVDAMIRTLTRQLQSVRFAREVAFVAIAYMAYEVVRSMAANRSLQAVENAADIIRLERALGIFTELNFQLAVLSYDAVIQFLSLWYFWGHFPLILAFAIWVFYRHPREYRWARNAIFFSGAMALLIYVVFPVAPPRLLPGAGFVDTLRNVFALQYGDVGFVNQYAAVPSMHQGFALIIGAALYHCVGGRKGGILLVTLPALMFVSIVATGNHWILDAVFGIAVALVGMTLATQIERHGRRGWVPVRRRGAALAHYERPRRSQDAASSS